MRTRLTLWHTAVVGLLVVLFVGGAYGFVAHTTRARTDASLANAVRELVGELGTDLGNAASLATTATEVMGELRFRTIDFALYDSRGRIVAASLPRPPRARLSEDGEPAFDAANLGRLLAAGHIGGTTFVSLGDPEGGFRAATVLIHAAGAVYFAAAAQSVHDDAETLAEARLAMRIAIPAALLLAAAGGWLLARNSLAPMVAMREQTARIGAGNLAERVPIATPTDEVGELAKVVNDLLARLERAFSQQRQFMADASHELRTPLAVIQSETSRALSGVQRNPAEYADALEVVRDAGHRLRRIVDDLFLLARADAGELPVQRVRLYLDEVIADSARSVQSLAEARNVRMVVAPTVETVVEGDEQLLYRLVLNLLDNAIKFSGAGSTVTVRLVNDAAGLRVEVEDTGPGIPREVQPHIFERFVRASDARTHDGESATSGAGLGLAIARWIAEAHGGRLELDRSDARGTTFSLRLPRNGSASV